MTEILPIDPREPDPATIERAAAIIRVGGTVAFPTETVYGLGANATDPAAVARVFEAKGRDPSDPLIVHIARPEDLGTVAASVSPVGAALARAFWPGPLTLVVPKRPIIPDNATAGLPSVAVRCPSHPVAHALIVAVGVPVVAPSANAFTRTSATTAEHVREDLDERIDLILDGGPADAGIESTVVDVTAEPPRLLRPGAVSREEVEAVLAGLDPPRVLGGRGSGRTASPGQMLRHYAPRAPLTYLEGQGVSALAQACRGELDRGRRVGVLLTGEDVDAFAEFGDAIERRVLGSRSDTRAIARRLFAAIRSLDAAGVDAILVADFGDDDLGPAIRDRLRRASTR